MGTERDVDKYIGHNIRFHRLQRGLSQRKMAAMLGMPYQQIQKYEAGQLRVSAVKLRQIAQALGINISELVDDASAPGMDDLGIFELYATLDANDQNFIRSLVTRLARERPT